MKILYIERQHTDTFSYYNEIMKAVGNEAQTYQYSNWSPKQKLNLHVRDLATYIRATNFVPEVFLFGFGWTDCSYDYPNVIDGLRESGIPTAVILNKEYAALDKKLDWIKDLNPICAFTVHHDYQEYEKTTGIPFYQLPFAVNPDIFKDYGEEYDCDFGFTGIVRPEQTNNWRQKIEERSREWEDINFSFSAHRRDTLESYARRISRSKIWLSTTGPGDLVGPRYYEVMAAGRTLLMCNRFDRGYEGLFSEDEHCVMFETLEELEDKLRYYLANEDKRVQIIRNAQAHTLKHHTWQERAQRVISGITENLEKKTDE